jgi:hypothetical protein
MKGEFDANQCLSFSLNPKKQKRSKKRILNKVTFRIIVIQIRKNATTCQFGKNLARFGKR